MENESAKIKELWLALVKARRDGNAEAVEGLQDALAERRLHEWRHKPANLVRELEYRQRVGRPSDAFRVVKQANAA